MTDHFYGYNMVMIMVNINEAKAKLSEFVEAAGKGERVLICRHNRPVAELRPIESVRAGSRDLTPMYPGAAFTPPAFFAPLSEDEIDAWEGRSRADVLRVAEQPDEYRAPRPRRKRKVRR
jgi:prevent-host-death family protein